MESIEVIKTPIGFLQIHYNGEYIYSIQFNDLITEPTNKNKLLITAFNNYFNGKSNEIACKFKFSGTNFQVKVWNEIKNIPYGKIMTYKDIAMAINEPKSYRAVANACGQNPVALLIPCHRVVGKNNDGGYKWGIKKKNWLLQLERDNIKK